MEWILLMQIIITGNQYGGTGGSIDTARFETYEQCKRAEDAFINKMPRWAGGRNIYRKANCVQIK